MRLSFRPLFWPLVFSAIAAITVLGFVSRLHAATICGVIVIGAFIGMEVHLWLNPPIMAVQQSEAESVPDQAVEL
jgi:hypothetical protein